MCRTHQYPNHRRQFINDDEEQVDTSDDDDLPGDLMGFEGMQADEMANLIEHAYLAMAGEAEDDEEDDGSDDDGSDDEAGEDGEPDSDDNDDEEEESDDEEQDEQEADEEEQNADDENEEQNKEAADKTTPSAAKKRPNDDRTDTDTDSDSDDAGPSSSTGKKTADGAKSIKKFKADKAAAGSSSDDDDSDASKNMQDFDDSDEDDDDDDDDDDGGRMTVIDDDEDDVVKAIIANTKTDRNHPPDLKFEDFIVDISFHPKEDIIAVGTMGGEITLTRYSNEENTEVASLECHIKAIRDLEFSDDGRVLFSASKDKSIVLSDTETAQMKRVYEKAHEVPVYRMAVLCENTFATGDEDGVVKFWDQRVRGSAPVFSIKEVDDYITSILTNSQGKLLLTTSGDGYLTTFNLAARKLYVQSEPYDEELTCMGLFRNESKLVVGSSKGRFYTYNWDEFGLHSNMFPGPRSPLSLMIPVTDRIAVTGGEEGVVRAMHMMPGRNLGVVGQHPLGVEAMDISNSGELIASSSHENDIKFWNIKYFEDMTDVRLNEKQNKRREERHNLPSSKHGNVGDFFSDMM